MTGRALRLAALLVAIPATAGAQAREEAALAAEVAAARGDHAVARAWAVPVAAAWRSGGQGGGWTAAAHLLAGRALRLLGNGDPEAVREALAAFDAAVAADTASLEGRLRAADLLLERYNAPDARAGYREVLLRDPDNGWALGGLARAAALEGSAEAATLAERALGAAPMHAPALLALARLRLDAEDRDSAAALAARALDDRLAEPVALGILGAAAWLADDSTGTARFARRADTIAPQGAAFHAALADAAARARRYADAVEFAREATRRDSLDTNAWGLLGLNLLRTGRIEAGRAALERAFAGDPFHVWHKNTLDLLDLMAGFRTIRTPRFEIVAPARDAEFLAAVLGPLLEEAHDTLAARYDYVPPALVRLELFARHADFSVRTVGLVGMGALGVSFGTVLAMDAPAARPPGSWNIGSTAWHELAHTFTLGASAHRVPRWVSEGLSVVEERRARPGWGSRAALPLVEALHRGTLLPIARLNDGFTRPSGPGGIGLAYHHASLVMEHLEAEHGIAAIRALLAAFADGCSEPDALRRATALEPDSLQRRFDAWLRARYAAPLAALAAGHEGVYGTLLRDGRAALEAEAPRRALALFREAAERFPEDAGADGPRAGEALALLALGDTAAALGPLALVTGGDETAADANRLEARLRLARHDSTGARRALERATWILPEEVALRRELAALLEALDDRAAVVRERRALAGLNRTDPLTARTDLAAALLAAGDATAARRELLGVLEAAPGYERAQLLLLEARAAAAGGGTP